MKKFYSMLPAFAFVTLLAVDVSYLCTNGALLTQVNASSSSSTSNTSSTSDSDSSTNFQKETLTGQSLYVTKISGSASGSFTIGMRISKEVAAELKGEITAETKDEYKINCYPGGKCPCTAIDWHMCASNGCPEAGLSKC